MCVCVCVCARARVFLCVGLCGFFAGFLLFIIYVFVFVLFCLFVFVLFGFFCFLLQNWTQYPLIPPPIMDAVRKCLYVFMFLTTISQDR